MDMENMKKLLEKLSEGISEVKASQAEMKTGLSDEISSFKRNRFKDMKERQNMLKTGWSDEIKSVQDKTTQDTNPEDCNSMQF